MIAELKRYKKLKRSFSREFNVTERLVQQYADELIVLYKNLDKGYIEPEDLRDFAKNPTTLFHGYFDWDNNDPWLAGQAERLLDRLSLVVGSDNIVYQMTKKEE